MIKLHKVVQQSQKSFYFYMKVVSDDVMRISYLTLIETKLVASLIWLFLIYMLRTIKYNYQMSSRIVWLVSCKKKMKAIPIVKYAPRGYLAEC